MENVTDKPLAEEKSLTLAKNKEEINALLVAAKLDDETVKSVTKKFDSFIESLYKWQDEASTLVVTEMNQVEEMNTAARAVKVLKKSLKDVDDTRKLLKEDTLRKGQAIDGIGRWFKAKIEPLIAHFDTQANFVAIQEKKRLDERYLERSKLIEPYSDVNMYLNIREMSDQAFAQCLEDLKGLKQAKIDREAKAKQDAIDAENLRKENALLLEKNKVLEDQVKKTPASTPGNAFHVDYVAPTTSGAALPWEEEDAHDIEMAKQVIAKLNAFMLPEMKSERGKKAIADTKLLLAKVVNHINTTLRIS